MPHIDVLPLPVPDHGRETVEWHSYVRFLVSMLFFIGGIAVAMMSKFLITWFFRDLTGIQIWLSNEELDQRLNLHNLVEHNSCGARGHAGEGDFGTLRDYTSSRAYENDVIETYDDTRIRFTSGPGASRFEVKKTPWH